AVSGADLVVVVDRAISYGARISGPVALEVLSALHTMGADTKLMSVVAGIGQRAVTELTVREMVEYAFRVLDRGRIPGETLYWGVRGVKYE
ncbi:MAG: hypothetical protein F7C34_00305, partial [Desulfurococcales archaeon]|nr:hypothetical protein [Desulfurococcales archaeon]